MFGAVWCKLKVLPNRLPRVSRIALVCVLLPAVPDLGLSQESPSSPNRPWPGGAAVAGLETRRVGAPGGLRKPQRIDPEKIYSLPELIDLAEENNPQTRLAWHSAKAQAASVGVAKSAMLPTLAAVATSRTFRQRAFVVSEFVRQTQGLFEPALNLNYTIFDFGQRAGRIEASQANLLAANLTFNDTHLRVIYQVMTIYYRLLNAAGQQESARATLLNAQTVQRAAEARLEHGLATLPDVLQARAATAQAEFDLQTTIGAEEIARGDLATALDLSVATAIRVKGIDELPPPAALDESVETAIDRAFDQRPDLKSRVAEVRASMAQIKVARSAYFPALSFTGAAGGVAAHGFQRGISDTYAFPAETWDARLSLRWALFDGGERRNTLARAEAERARAEAQVDATHNQVADEVWTAYSNARTALRRQQAAAALLVASSESYAAALEAYKLGVRNLLDVVAAQRALALARTADVTARTELLTATATLAFRTGDLLQTRGREGKP